MGAGVIDCSLSLLFTFFFFFSEWGDHREWVRDCRRRECLTIPLERAYFSSTIATLFAVSAGLGGGGDLESWRTEGPPLQIKGPHRVPHPGTNRPYDILRRFSIPEIRTTLYKQLMLVDASLLLCSTFRTWALGEFASYRI